MASEPLLGRRITRCCIRHPGGYRNALVDGVCRRVTYRAEILRAVIRDVDGKRDEAYKGERSLELMLEDLEESEAARTSPAAQRVPDQPRRERRQPVRRPLPDHLPREEIVHDPGLVCPGCGGTRFAKLGADVTKVLEKIPARLKVIRHIRPKLSCRLGCVFRSIVITDSGGR
jgi:transposase